MENLIGKNVWVSTACIGGYDADRVRECSCTIKALGSVLYGDQYFKVADAFGNTANVSFGGGILRMGT